MKWKLGLALVVIAAISWPLYSSYGTVETVQVTVESKERVNDQYLIFTAEETFKSTDSWAFLKFNSSDVYGAVKQGATCQLKVNGFRIPFFSSYRNIITATC